MVEEVSPESKVYVKEEVEKMRKEFKEDLKDAQSKATKTFSTVALIVGLLGSLGVYGFTKDFITNAIKTRINVELETKLNKENLTKFANDRLRLEAAVIDANRLAEDAKTYADKAEKQLEKISDPQRIKNLPVGTIVSSILEPLEFFKAFGDLDRATKDWVLADGRPIAATSGYSQLSGRMNTPDLRGMFLRGMNKGRNDGKQDPDERKAGDYQQDALQEHGHKTDARKHGWGAMGDTQGWTKSAGEAPPSKRDERAAAREDSGRDTTQKRGGLLLYQDKLASLTT